MESNWCGGRRHGQTVFPITPADLQKLSEQNCGHQAVGFHACRRAPPNPPLFRDEADRLADGIIADGSVEVIYNPLRYAWDVHAEYVRRAGVGGAKTSLLGMNPGPHGMGQMGIPFAATTVVRELLGISGIEVGDPVVQHPRRPINGLLHPKEEVSGTRLWGALEESTGHSNPSSGNLRHQPLPAHVLLGTISDQHHPDKVKAGLSVSG